MLIECIVNDKTTRKPVAFADVVSGTGTFVEETFVEETFVEETTDLLPHTAVVLNDTTPLPLQSPNESDIAASAFRRALLRQGKAVNS